MQSSLLWRRAILRVASATEEALEAQIIRLFFTEVGMIYDEDLGKVRFICSSEYVYRTFAPYSWRFYLELKAILGVNDLGFSLEAVSSREYQLLQRNGSLLDRQTLKKISLEAADGEDIGTSVFAVSPCIAMDGTAPSVNIPMGAAAAAAHASSQPFSGQAVPSFSDRSFIAGGTSPSSLHATQQPQADCAPGMSASHATQQPQADCAPGMSASHATQQPQTDCASGMSSFRPSAPDQQGTVTADGALIIDNSSELSAESSYPEHDAQAVQSASAQASSLSSTCKDGMDAMADDSVLQSTQADSHPAGTLSSDETVGSGAAAAGSRTDDGMHSGVLQSIGIPAGRTTAAHAAADRITSGDCAEGMAHKSTSLDRNGEAGSGQAMTVADNIDLSADSRHTAGGHHAADAASVNRSDAAPSSGKAGAASAAAGVAATGDQSVPAAFDGAAGAASDFSWQSDLSALKAAAAASADALRRASWGMFADFMARSDDQIADLSGGYHCADRTDVLPDYRVRQYHSLIAWAVSRGLMIDDGSSYRLNSSFKVTEDGQQLYSDIFGSMTVMHLSQPEKTETRDTAEIRHPSSRPPLKCLPAVSLLGPVGSAEGSYGRDRRTSLDSVVRATQLSAMSAEQRIKAQQEALALAVAAARDLYNSSTVVKTGWAYLYTAAEDAVSDDLHYAFPAVSTQIGDELVSLSWDSHGADLGVLCFDGLYTHAPVDFEYAASDLVAVGPYGQMPWDGSPVSTLHQVVLCDLYGSQLIDSCRNFSTVRGLAVRDLTDTRIASRLAAADYMAYKCLLTDLMCFDKSLTVLRPFVSDSQAASRQFVAQFNLNAPKLPGLPKRSFDDILYMPASKQGREASAPDAQAPSSSAGTPCMFLSRSFGPWLYLDNYRVESRDLRKTTTYCIDPLELQFAAATGVNLKAPANYHEISFAAAAHNVHHLVVAGEDISQAVEAGYSFNYSPDAEAENIHGLNGLSLLEQIEQINGWTEESVDEFEVRMTIDEAYFELSSRISSVRDEQNMLHDEFISCDAIIWDEIALEAARLIAASAQPEHIRDQEIHALACSAAALYPAAARAADDVSGAAAAGSADFADAWSFADDEVMNDFADDADDADDLDEDSAVASFDDDDSCRDAAITDGTILDIRHESADETQADDVMLADADAAMATGHDAAAAPAAAADAAAAAAVAASAAAAAASAAASGTTPVTDHVDSSMISGSQTHDGSWSRHEVCESDLDGMAHSATASASCDESAQSAGAAAHDAADAADMDESVTAMAQAVAADFLSGSVADEGAEAPRAINVIDTSDYSYFDNPVFKQAACSDEQVLRFYGRMAAPEPVVVPGMVLDVNDRAMHEGLLERDYIKNDKRSAHEHGAGWRAPFALTNADGSALPLPEDQAGADDLTQGAAGCEPDALMAMINERRKDMAAVMGRDLNLADAVNEDMAVQAARTWIAPVINVESGASAAMGLLDESLFPGADSSYQGAHGEGHNGSASVAADDSLIQSIIADTRDGQGSSLYADIVGEHSALPAALASGVSAQGFDDRFIPSGQSGAQAAPAAVPSVDLAELRRSIPGTAVPALPGTSVRGTGLNGASYDELRAMELKVCGRFDELNEHLTSEIWDSFFVEPEIEALPHRENVTLESLGEIDTRSLEERLKDDMKAAFSFMVVSDQDKEAFFEYRRQLEAAAAAPAVTEAAAPAAAAAAVSAQADDAAAAAEAAPQISAAPAAADIAGAAQAQPEAAAAELDAACAYAEPAEPLDQVDGYEFIDHDTAVAVLMSNDQADAQADQLMPAQNQDFMGNAHNDLAAQLAQEAQSLAQNMYGATMPVMPEQPFMHDRMRNLSQGMFGSQNASLEEQFAAVMAQVQNFADVDPLAQQGQAMTVQPQDTFQPQVAFQPQFQDQLQMQPQGAMQHYGMQYAQTGGFDQLQTPAMPQMQPQPQSWLHNDFNTVQPEAAAQAWIQPQLQLQPVQAAMQPQPASVAPQVQPAPAAAPAQVQAQPAPAQAAVQPQPAAAAGAAAGGAHRQPLAALQALAAHGASRAPVLMPGQKLHHGVVELTAADIANAQRMYEAALTSPDRSVLQSPYAAVSQITVMGQQSLMPGQMPNVGLGLPGADGADGEMPGIPAEDSLLIPVIPGRGRENRPRGRLSSLPVPVNSSRFNELYGDLSDPEKFKEAAARRAGESTYSKVLFPYMPTSGISEADRRIYDDYMVMLNAHYQSEVPLGEAISYSDFRKLGGSATTRTLLSRELARLPAIEAANARRKAQQERHMHDMNNLQNMGIMADGSWGSVVPDYAWRDPSDPTPVLPEAPLPPEMVANMSRRRRMAEPAGIPQSAFELPERVINPKKTFEKLFFDSNGRAAIKSALDICQVASPETFHCPVLVTGRSGTGKTHLLNAIANRIKCEQPDLRVALVTSEDFIKHFVESIAEMNRTRFSDKHVYLKAAFEAVDVLLLDDVQAFAKAVKSRWTVTDIIDFFSSTPGKRLVVTSGMTASELTESGMESDMISRLTSGITVDLTVPDIFYRRRMVRMLSDDLSIKPTEECVEYISWHMTGNGREIEGLVRSLANSLESHTRVDLEELNRQISRISSAKEEEFPVESIINLVCDNFGVTVQDVMSASKKANISMARSFAMCAVRDCYASMSLTDMGRLFKKDHSSVHEAIVRTRRRMAEKVELRNRYSLIIEAFEKLRAGK